MVAVFAIVGSAFGASSLARAACPPEDHDAASLAALKSREFVVVDAVEREAMAYALIDCLTSPDPNLRDGIAFSALQRWMRDGAFSPDVLRKLRARLDMMLLAEKSDADGVAKPFAALTLAEVARTDRIAPWMRADERAAMTQRAAAYLASVSDYRGYETGVGWRHGVAHGADWTMQLAMNPALDAERLRELARGIAPQVAPASGHAYVFGEPERLARATMAIARRDALDETEWRAWFAAVVPLRDNDDNAWNDPVWLARRHDASAFLHALYLQADREDTPGVAKLKAALIEALRELP
ncbi:MAG: DUF2785 domain-containing protein [Lysobacter sp.]|nr:DUF2785 domain-containing protein [Lysobacter sp.]